ncbi:hypothetical protein V2J09_012293 [Rumex salicifolius]
MVESGPIRIDETKFTECFSTVFTNLYILRLALSAGIGGLLFGYDTGVISGALLYIKEDFEEVRRKTVLQETIVAMAVAGAIVGAGVGGWLNDRKGRRPTMMIADALFFVGAIVMATAPTPSVIIIGRILIGLGVGMASMTSPLYISETSPSRIRGALGSTNGFLITFGQFAAYLINLAFTRVTGTWRWMLGVAAIPAFLQFVLMFMLPESPRWLYRNGRTMEAEAILAKIYPEEQYKEEVHALKMSVEKEIGMEGEIGNHESLPAKVKKAFGNKVFRRGLTAGITVQVAQQLVGINTVMYYSPTIVQLAGFASNQTALALSLVTSGLNAVGSIVSMLFVDRYGRRRLMMVSMLGIIVCLVVLASLFYESAQTAPKVNHADSIHFNSTCPSYLTASDSGHWDCMRCLKAPSSSCAFCASPGNERMPGACIAQTNQMKSACGAEHRTYFTVGCPSKTGLLAVVFLGAYIITYSPGMGTVPWVLNSEIYPLRYRGIGGGFAAVSNWTSNLIVSETFLTLTEKLGASGTFLLFAAFSVIGLVAIFLLVPETKGLPIEDVERMLEKGFKPSFSFSLRGDQADDNDNNNNHHDDEESGR